MSGESTIGEIIKNKEAVQLVDEISGGLLSTAQEGNIAFLVDRKLDEVLRMVLIGRIADAVKLDAMLKELYGQLKQIK